MFVTHVLLKNWRNFRTVDVPLRDSSFLLGPNASGKSNFLDVFRFLRDISKPQGGGLQKAIKDRGGISKLRCLHARRQTDVRIEISLSDTSDAIKPDWKYILAFKPTETGVHKPSVICEEVWKDGKRILNRPNEDDKKDQEQLTETYLENVRSNKGFREIAEFFSRTTYLHLVPQLLKFGDRIAGHLLEDDPFGQGFLDRIAKASDRVRTARLKWIEKALTVAIPHFKQLVFERDEANGQPHLAARHEHHRPNAGWQREDQFSDGTLRLIGLLWSLLEGDSLLLLEEPELSLNQAIVEQIPLMLKNVLRDRKRTRQVIISTHSEALLSNPGIDARGVLLLESGREGTGVRTVRKTEAEAIKSGLTVAEVLLPKTRPEKAEQLGLDF
jgi:predicted ATPase